MGCVMFSKSYMISPGKYQQVFHEDITKPFYDRYSPSHLITTCNVHRKSMVNGEMFKNA